MDYLCDFKHIDDLALISKTYVTQNVHKDE
jgi:hypothetical protein